MTIAGPFGTKTYIQNLQNPFVNIKNKGVAAPKIDSQAWRSKYYKYLSQQKNDSHVNDVTIVMNFVGIMFKGKK